MKGDKKRMVLLFMKENRTATVAEEVKLDLFQLEDVRRLFMEALQD